MNLAREQDFGQEQPRIKTNVILCGDALRCLKKFASNSIDCVVTSPPYWALRDYGSKGQLGLEGTPDEYIARLCAVFTEIKRVLKDQGTCWVNLGDTYSAKSKSDNAFVASHTQTRFLKLAAAFQPRPVTSGVPDKSPCLIPFRFALVMIRLGWVLRNVIIWQKPNCLPSSAKDRFTVDFEYVFFFVKSKKYWFQPQHEPLHDSTKARVDSFMRNKEAFDPRRHKHQTGAKANHSPYQVLARICKNGLNPAGRNKRCVWRIPTQPFQGAHFATYPERLVDNPIKSGCPELICVKCGHGRAKIFRSRPSLCRWRTGREKNADDLAIRHSDCGCGAPFKPGIVLDPFFGSGTTGLVALRLKRDFVGIELNPKYLRLAMKRLSKSGFRVTSQKIEKSF